VLGEERERTIKDVTVSTILHDNTKAMAFTDNLSDDTSIQKLWSVSMPSRPHMCGWGLLLLAFVV
jgi:hypothetical protein